MSLNTNLESSFLKDIWIINISNLDGTLVTRMEVVFTKIEIKNSWKELKVLSYETIDEKFFQINLFLSYKLEDDKITISQIDSDKKHSKLIGEINEHRLSAQGEFLSSGFNKKILGYFFLINKNALNS